MSTVIAGGLTNTPTDPSLFGGATPEQVAAAVAEYIAKNPVNAPTAEQIASAVEEYLKNNPISGGVNAEQLTQAVNAAIQTAKESGAFDGASPVIETEGVEEGTLFRITNADGSIEDVFIRDGKDGEDGLPGLSAYQVAVQQQGFTGNATEWLDSLKGPQGEQGSQGEQGPKGDTGLAGKDGTNGTDGTSVTVQSVSESAADGGSNVVTFSDGKTLTVKNGSKGSKGDKGDAGSAGANGADGVSVSSVQQTTTSSEDGGSNVVTVTLSNGATSTFTVKNGSKGAAGKDGANGADGKTPIKGVDYFTTADITSVIQQVIDALGGTPVFGVVDASNNIILTGSLADGTYTLKYEDEDGNVTEIGDIVLSGEFTIPLTLTKGKIDSSTGNISGNGTDKTYFYSNEVEVEEGYSYSVHVSAGLNTTAKAVFWDADGNFMSSATLTLWNDATASSTTMEADYEVLIPSGAASFRIRVYNYAYSTTESANESLLATQNGVVLTAKRAA